MKRFTILSIFLLGLILSATAPANIAAKRQNQPVIIYLFWGAGCPHCESARAFLDEIMQEYPNIELRDYEVWYEVNNLDLFNQFAEKLGVEPTGVPFIIIGDQYWEGFSDSYAAEISDAISQCSLNGCTDIGEGIIEDTPESAGPAQIPTNSTFFLSRFTNVLIPFVLTVFNGIHDYPIQFLILNIISIY